MPKYGLLHIYSLRLFSVYECPRLDVRVRIPDIGISQFGARTLANVPQLRFAAAAVT